MHPSMAGEQFAEELSELHDGSISLFVTLPVFRQLLVSRRAAAVLARCEAVLGEHLAHLDGILTPTLSHADRTDGDLTSSLFGSLGRVRRLPASDVRDDEIVRLVQQAQLFLMGSCSFALQFAQHAGIDRAAYVLEASLARLGALALQFVPSPLDAATRDMVEAVA